MKKVSNDFKEKIKDIRQITARIINLSGTTQIEINEDDIYPVTYIAKGQLLKSNMKELDFEILNDLEVGSIINYQVGLLINGNFEYVNYGNFIINQKEKSEDTNTYQYTAYDNMLRSQIDYVPLDNDLFPLSLKDYLKKICEYIGISYEDSEFANQDRILTADPFPNNNGYKYRDVLDDIAECTGGEIIINSNDNLQVIYPTETNDIIDEEFLNDTNVKFSQKYGAVNSIVLSRSAESDKIYLNDDESISKNGLCEFDINDNLIMNGNNRNEWLSEILEKLDGLEFFITDFTSKGILYYDLFDYYSVKVGDVTYKCLMLNDEIKTDQGITEDIYAEEPNKNLTDYAKSDKQDIKGLNQTTLIVDKKTQEIQATIQQAINEVQTNLSQLTNTVNDINAMFSITGGSNLIKNSQFLFADENATWLLTSNGNNPYNNLGASYDSGLINKTISNAKIQLRNIKCQSTSTNITGLNASSSYTLGFKYSQDELTTTTITLVGVNTRQEVLNKTYTSKASFKEELVKFIANESDYIMTITTSTTTSDITKGYFYIYDLMLNAGDKTNWQVASGETYSTNTRLSRNGIAVFSTGSGVMTSMTAGAFNIRKAKSVEDYSGDVVTDFTSDGIDTRRLTSDETHVGKYVSYYSNRHYYEYIDE